MLQENAMQYINPAILNPKLGLLLLGILVFEMMQNDPKMAGYWGPESLYGRLPKLQEK